MDKEQARFILRSFRPDGADVEDQDFAGALKLAMEDRELGEWLAGERSFDAAFAKALGSIDLPEGLRDDITACLAAEGGGLSQVKDGEGAALVGALASIQPPTALREAVLAAMDATAAKGSRSKVTIFRRAAMPLAAAAGIALAFFVTRSGPAPNFVSNTVPVGTVPVEALQAGFIRTFESPLFNLDENRDDPRVLIQHLKERELPCPKFFPPGLRNVSGIGCRELVIDGKRGSLVCFDERENGIVHLVIFRREDICQSFSSKCEPEFAKQGNWATARWGDDSHVFLLMSHSDVGKLAELF